MSQNARYHTQSYLDTKPSVEEVQARLVEALKHLEWIDKAMGRGPDFGDRAAHMTQVSIEMYREYIVKNDPQIAWAEVERFRRLYQDAKFKAEAYEGELRATQRVQEALNRLVCGLLREEDKRQDPENYVKSDLRKAYEAALHARVAK